ncbi:hypothetical protein HYFRA_00006179 [Hymenoscyphus fraxineus]|uniref:Uncharacterized protein n=1 Tax=Hymenoscyphus fraxineus TaxID=746836 RepID=A0A9N9Q1C7_9HELO|nr:hypothetical protein HYFRA_00006179 [Hymenoscyphus fraxineus]
MTLIRVSSPVAEWREMRTFWYRRYLPALFCSTRSPRMRYHPFISHKVLYCFSFGVRTRPAYIYQFLDLKFYFGIFPKRSSDARGILPSQNTYPVVTLKVLILVDKFRRGMYDFYLCPSLSASCRISSHHGVRPLLAELRHLSRIPALQQHVVFLPVPHCSAYGDTAKLDIDKRGRALSIARASFIGCCYLGALSAADHESERSVLVVDLLRRLPLENRNLYLSMPHVRGRVSKQVGKVIIQHYVQSTGIIQYQYVNSSTVRRKCWSRRILRPRCNKMSVSFGLWLEGDKEDSPQNRQEGTVINTFHLPTIYNGIHMCHAKSLWHMKTLKECPHFAAISGLLRAVEVHDFPAIQDTVSVLNVTIISLSPQPISKQSIHPSCRSPGGSVLFVCGKISGSEFSESERKLLVVSDDLNTLVV